MKRVAILIVLAIAAKTCSVSCCAEDKQLKHSVHFSVNDDMTSMEYGMIGSGVINDFLKPNPSFPREDMKWKGGFSLGYSYRVLNNFAVGCELSYADTEYNLIYPQTGKVYKKCELKAYSAMALADLTYYKHGYLSLHGVGELGVISTLKGNSSIAFQVVPLEFRVGTDRVSSFIALGFGVKGIVSAGFRFGF